MITPDIISIVTFKTFYMVINFVQKGIPHEFLDVDVLTMVKIS